MIKIFFLEISVPSSVSCKTAAGDVIMANCKENNQLRILGDTKLDHNLSVTRYVRWLTVIEELWLCSMLQHSNFIQL